MPPAAQIAKSRIVHSILVRDMIPTRSPAATPRAMSPLATASTRSRASAPVTRIHLDGSSGLVYASMSRSAYRAHAWSTITLMFCGSALFSRASMVPPLASPVLDATIPCGDSDRFRRKGQEMHAVGFDIGGTKIAAGVVDDDGRIVAKARRDTSAGDADGINQAIAEVVAEFAQDFEFDAIGLAAAGFA